MFNAEADVFLRNPHHREIVSDMLDAIDPPAKSIKEIVRDFTASEDLSAIPEEKRSMTAIFAMSRAVSIQAEIESIRGLV